MSDPKVDFTRERIAPGRPSRNRRTLNSFLPVRQPTPVSRLGGDRAAMDAEFKIGRDTVIRAVSIKIPLHGWHLGRAARAVRSIIVPVTLNSPPITLAYTVPSWQPRQRLDATMRCHWLLGYAFEPLAQALCLPPWDQGELPGHVRRHDQRHE